MRSGTTPSLCDKLSSTQGEMGSLTISCCRNWCSMWQDIMSCGYCMEDGACSKHCKADGLHVVR